MDRRVWRKFDIILLGLVILLILYGVIMIYSANQNQDDLRDLWWTQLTRAGIGLALLFFVAAIDYRYYLSFYKIFYVVMLIFLGTLFIAAELTAGTLRWLDFTLFPVQPSELAKIIVIIVSAKIMADRDGHMNRIHSLIVTFLLVLPPLILIYMQPDLGTTIIMGVTWFIMALMAGISMFHVALLGAGGLLFLPIVWLTMADYQRERVYLFIDPTSDPDAYFNIEQALISIGSGEMVGKGFSIGTQNQLHFLRVRHTDFIFSVIGEELGFIGSILLFGLIILLIWRIMRAADLASDPFGRLICIGVAAVIFFQSFVNLGVNLGIMPVTGTPLPFVSYGGSSLFAFLISIGLVQSVLMRHRALDFEGA
ncbi:rod shape-determining protein RodA [Anaerolineales bacterium HSG6]|nr:rod shape-determining protein RodA [Anaerolineales bacterium HSG6]MDM8529872.1 rod shape-determining protein RodA [Anaerolineales bacterium HSG25]